MATKKGREFLLKKGTLGASFAFTVTPATDLIGKTAHGLTVNTMIVFLYGAPPAPLEEGKIYYVNTPLTDTFKVSLTSGGSAIDITGSEFGAACVCVPVTAVTTVAGCNSNDWTINNEPVDVSTKDDAGWRRLLEGVALKSVSMSAAGKWQTAAAKAAVIADILAGTLGFYQVVSGFGDRFEGHYLLTEVQSTGVHDGVEEFTFKLESSGGVGYTAGT